MIDSLVVYPVRGCNIAALGTGCIRGGLPVTGIGTPGCLRIYRALQSLNTFRSNAPGCGTANLPYLRTIYIYPVTAHTGSAGTATRAYVQYINPLPGGCFHLPAAWAGYISTAAAVIYIGIINNGRIMNNSSGTAG